MNQENTERIYAYEAVVYGTSLGAYFASYIFKKNRIRFAQYLNASSEEPFPFAAAKEEIDAAKEMYLELAKSVGYIPNAGNEDREELHGKERLKNLISASIENQIFDQLPLENSGVTDSTVILNADDNLIECGAKALAVVREKQKTIESYMKKLRIKSGKQAERPLVYVTQSKSWFYAREAVMKYAIDQGVAPINPFMNYGFYLNGAADREEITECCHQMVRAAGALWVFGPVSEAILTDIVVAVMEGKEIVFFSISENTAEIHEIPMEEIVFEREVHAGQIKKNDLLDFVGSTLKKTNGYVQMSLFD